jgi:acyl-CoA synthetase (AMP-forming)/AMP-acid ligase II
MKNYQDTINKLYKLLGLYNFNSYKIAETGEELICEGELAVDEPIYTITSNGQLPAPDGDYILEDTTKIKIQDGKIKELKYDMENDMENELSFAEATLKDGTTLKSPNFEIGDDVKIVDADGNETPAPDGEHEIVLKDGTVMKIELEGGKITEKESVELPETDEQMADLSIGNDEIETEGQIEEDFKKTIMEKIDTIMSKMEEMMSNYEDMKSKVAKFSKEPAGEPVRQPKNIINEFNEAKNDYISQLVKVRRSTYAK